MFLLRVLCLIVPASLARAPFHMAQALTQPDEAPTPGPDEAPIYDMEALEALQADLERGVGVEQLFSNYKLVLHKNYPDMQEENHRKQIFAARVRRIRAHKQLYDKGDKSYTLAVNKFSDMSHDEFVKMYTIERLKKKKESANNLKTAPAALQLDPHLEELTFRRKKRSTEAASESEIPAYVNWKERGYVTSVKDQGDCGSCWAFGVVGSLEGQLYRKTGRTVSLSAQQLVDCDTISNGCDGGFPTMALKYITSAGGVMAEREYPYMAKEGPSCRHNRSMSVPGSQVTGHILLPANDELELKAAVARVGPIIASMDINPKDIMDYGKGVFYDPSCESKLELLDHSVVVVGYGSDPVNYWLVKNSMGPTWGEGGYIKVARNRNNQCGLATRALYPAAVGDSASSISAALFVIISGVLLGRLCNFIRA